MPQLYSNRSFTILDTLNYSNKYFEKKKLSTVDVLRCKFEHLLSKTIN